MSGDDGEPCTIYRHAIRRARKEHRCSACRTLIRPSDYYAEVFLLCDGYPDHFKRCGSCEKTWQHLKALCDEHNRLNGDDRFPLEDLSCGKSYASEWEAWGPVPDEIAALPLLSADERGALLRPA